MGVHNLNPSQCPAPRPKRFEAVQRLRQSVSLPDDLA